MIAQDLQQRGIISYRRGRIIIRDRARLEAAACNCYAMLGADTGRPSSRPERVPSLKASFEAVFDAQRDREIFHLGDPDK